MHYRCIALLLFHLICPPTVTFCTSLYYYPLVFLFTVLQYRRVMVTLRRQGAAIVAVNNFAPTLRMDITMFSPPILTELTLESI